MAVLRAISGSKTGELVLLDKAHTIFGRTTSCDVVLDADSVSRQHALIIQQDNRYFIQDLGSQNGTHVNRQRLTPGPSGRTRLRSDDEINIRGFRFVFDDENESKSSHIGVGDETPGTGAGFSSSIKLPRAQAASTGKLDPKLDAVLRIISDVTEAIDLKDVLPRILDSLLRTFPPAQSGLVMFYRNEQLTPAASRRRDGKTQLVQFSRTVVRHAIEIRSAILTTDAVHDERFADSDSIRRLQLRSIMCAPLLIHDEKVTGAIWLDIVGGKTRFNMTDLDLLAGIARLIAIVVENSRLHDEAIKKEKALRQAARMTSIGTLAAGIAHEINNPVAAVMNSAETALAVLESNEPHVLRECLDVIVESTQRCRRIVDNVLKFSRQGQSEKERICLNEAVSRSVRLVRYVLDSTGATLQVQLHEHELPVMANPLEAEQIITNLLQNAAQSGTNVEVTVSTELTDECATVRVVDNGRGMNNEQLENLFDPFYTSRQTEGGTGLGLSIVHGIVEDHGGTIQVKSAPGNGTVVAVSLPRELS